MKIHFSIEGAYDQALEAAARRIQLVSRDSNMSGSSGYLSDTEKSSGRESSEPSAAGRTSPGGVDTEGSSLTDDPTSLLSRASSNSLGSTSSSSSSNNANDSFVSDDDLDIEISYLEKKQAILERASAALKRDEAYTALKAQDIINGRLVPYGSSLWSEARAILDVLKEEGMVFESSPFSDEGGLKRKETSSPLGSSIGFLRPPTYKRPKIDLSTVELVSAADFGGPLLGSAQHLQWESDARTSITPVVDTSVTSATATTIDISPISVPSDGHWMAQAMIYQISALATANSGITAPSHSTTTNNSLDVLIDPTLGPSVLSPSHLPFHNAIQLTDALGLTSSAQLIVMPIPPFSIVHANKALCNLSGLTHSQVMGKPIEAVLQVVQEIPGLTATAGDASGNSGTALRSQFILEPLSSSGCTTRNIHRLCQIQVAPITEQSQNMRGMTHVLVKIEARVEEEGRSVTGGGAAISTDGSTFVSDSYTSDGSIAPAPAALEKATLGLHNSATESSHPIDSATHHTMVG